MAVIDVYRKNLAQLPSPVRSKMEEVGLYDTLEHFFESFTSDATEGHDDIEQLHDLISWTLSVLLSATGPLESQTFQELQDHYSAVASHAHNGNWQECLHQVRPILEALSVIPTVSPKYSLESAQLLRNELNRARDTLTASENATGIQRREVEAAVDKAAEDAGRAISDSRDAAIAEMERLLEDVRERYGFTAGQVLGGAHEIAAEAEEKLAVNHGQRSRRTMWGAVIWAAVAQIWWLTPLAPDWDKWFDTFRSLPVVGSPIVILLFVAKREGRVAAEHRRRHETLRSLALQFKSWEPYRSTLKDLPDDAKLKLEQQIAGKLFAGESSRVSLVRSWPRRERQDSGSNVTFESDS